MKRSPNCPPRCRTADHSADTYGSVKNLATLVSALQGSTTLIRQLNENLASVTGVLANDPNEIASAIKDLNDVVAEVKTFVADNRDTLGTTTEKLAAVSQTLAESLGDIKQLLHILPTTASNAVNLYQPAQGTLSGALAVNNFANPINFLCGAIQAASRLGSEQSAKLCVQYLAPIVKTASTTSFRSASIPSWEPPHGPTKSPTAKTGCARTTYRHRTMPRYRPVPQHNWRPTRRRRRPAPRCSTIRRPGCRA